MGDESRTIQLQDGDVKTSCLGQGFQSPKLLIAADMGGLIVMQRMKETPTVL